MSATARNRVGRSAKKGNRCLDCPCTGSATRCDLIRFVAHASGLTLNGWVAEPFEVIAFARPFLAPSASPPAYLHVPILGQLPPAQLPRGDATEPGALEVVRLDAPLGCGPPPQQPFKDPPQQPSRPPRLVARRLRLLGLKGGGFKRRSGRPRGPSLSSPGSRGPR
jgi:hypothetical protein